MNKKYNRKFLIFFITLFLTFLIFLKPAFAIEENDCLITVGGVETSTSTDNAPSLPNDGSSGRIFGGALKYSFEIIVCSENLSDLDENGERVVAHMSTTAWGSGSSKTTLTSNEAGCLTGTFESGADSASEFYFDVELSGSNEPICLREYGHLSPLPRDKNNDFGYDSAVSQMCDYLSFSPPNPISGDQIEINGHIPIWFFSSNGLVVTPDGKSYNLSYRFKDSSGKVIDEGERISKNDNLLVETSFKRTYVDLANSAYSFEFYLSTANSYSDINLCQISFSIGTADSPGGLLSEDAKEYSICQTNLAHNDDALKSCIDCYDKKGIWTAVGCIDKDPKSMISKFILIGTGIVGGVFLLRVLAAAFILTTSQGDVKKTSEAKEMITEAILGVMVIIFSVTLIQFFGSDILKIPGFGS
ncbi:MAG: hypothetical protein GW942_01385 [Candidatus Pacebacteria bacterium]|nr:hypothetical protein [Candidatus Paceibacterota bacterium]